MWSTKAKKKEKREAEKREEERNAKERQDKHNKALQHMREKRKLKEMMSAWDEEVKEEWDSIEVMDFEEDEKTEGKKVNKEHEDDSEENEDEIEIVGIQEKYTNQIVGVKTGTRASTRNDKTSIQAVTPPAKKTKVKKGEGGIKKEDPCKNNRWKRFDLDLYKESYIVTSIGCYNGSSTLTLIPGGFIDHWKTESYIRMMHDKLLSEITSWETVVKKFVRECSRDTAGTTMFSRGKCEQINGVFCNKMELVKKKIKTNNSIVLHSMCLDGIKAVLWGCDERLAKLIYFFCQANVFHVRFDPKLKEKTYEIVTLFNCGDGQEASWNFQTLF